MSCDQVVCLSGWSCADDNTSLSCRMVAHVWRLALFVVGLGMPQSHGQVNLCFNDKYEPPSSSFFPVVEQFGLSLFRQVTSRKPDTSVFLSPYSVWSVLSLAYFGSEGETRRQLEKVLSFSSKTSTYYNWKSLKFMIETNPGNEASSGVRLKSSNTAYLSDQLEVEPCINSILSKDLRSIDFTNSNRARSIINNDVKKTTEGRIPELIQFLPPQTRFALVNAIFLKGQWEFAFNPKETHRQEFLVPPGRFDGVVEMMMQEGTFKHVSSPTLNASMLELPYLNSNISMYLLLPNTWSTDTILRQLTDQNLNAAISTMVPKPVKVGLPKFKMTTRIEEELMNILIAMGIEALFAPGFADLTAFTKSASLNVDAAIHQATVEINEEGTVAAAATSLINTRFGGPPVEFICNRPFVFLIRDKFTGITLFAGNVLNTSEMEKV